MSRRVELLTAALSALPALSAVINDEFDPPTADPIRQQLRTARDLATSVNGLPALASISQQGTPALLEQNPRFQQLQQCVQNLTNEREALAEERDALTEERDTLLAVGQGLEARYRAIETDLECDRATIVTLTPPWQLQLLHLQTQGDLLRQQSKDPLNENESPSNRNVTDPKTNFACSLHNYIPSSTEMPTNLSMSNIGWHTLMGS